MFRIMVIVPLKLMLFNFFKKHLNVNRDKRRQVHLQPKPANALARKSCIKGRLVRELGRPRGRRRRDRR